MPPSGLVIVITPQRSYAEMSVLVFLHHVNVVMADGSNTGHNTAVWRNHQSPSSSVILTKEQEDARLVLEEH